MSRLALVIPCYNEEHRLPADELRTFSAPGLDLELVLVNDGSSDGTLQLLEKLRAANPERFTVVNLAKNSGKAEAVRQGILAALERKPDYTGFWDADLATPLSELPVFVEILDTRPNVQMVMGARVRLLGRDIARHASRHYFGRVGATLISQTLRLAVYDTQCGAKLFRATSDTRHVFSTPFLSRWIFDVEIIARYVRLLGRDMAARSIVEYPVRRWHDVKGSKLKSHDFARALRDLWRIRRAYKMKRT
ncbi:MAG TPA: glycosyltransferase [Thermoanaerobaculia bacterium]|nr:glycosyltransferase [Thermoanaerobaculia bacterium]